ARQDRLFAERKLKPGDQFSYLSYEPVIVHVVTTRVQVKDYEEVEVLGKKQKLLRVEARPDKIENVQLPTLVSWLDDKYQPVRSARNTWKAATSSTATMPGSRSTPARPSILRPTPGTRRGGSSATSTTRWSRRTSARRSPPPTRRPGRWRATAPSTPCWRRRCAGRRACRRRWPSV